MYFLLMEVQLDETCLNRCSDALLVAAQALALFPAHSLQHLVANVVTVQTVLRGLLIVTTAEKRK